MKTKSVKEPNPIHDKDIFLPTYSEKSNQMISGHELILKSTKGLK
jgi:hypothetical protein